VSLIRLPEIVSVRKDFSIMVLTSCVSPVTLNVSNVQEYLKQIVYRVLSSQFLLDSTIAIPENVFVQMVIIRKMMELVKNRSVVNVTFLAVNVLDL
jgi:hypothetical protein